MLEAADRNERAELAWKIAACALIAAGIWLRFRRLAWMEFGRDQELLLLRAMEAQRTIGAAHGLRYSTGLVMPPFLLDLFALVLFVTRDPVRIAVFVAAINLLGLVAFHRFARRQLGARTALWTTVLLATMPWAVLRSRSVWVPDCLFPFVALAFLLLFSLERPWRLWKTCATAGALAILFQVHQPAWLLAPPLLVYAILYRVRIPGRHLLAAAAVFALLYARWFAHEVASGFDDLCWSWHSRSTPSGAPAPATGDALGLLLWALRQTGAGGLDYLSPKVGSSEWLLPPAPWIATLASAAAIVLTGAAVLSAVVRSGATLASRKETPGDRAVVLSTLVVVLVLGGYWIGGAGALPHYLVPLQPFLALLVAWALGRYGAERAVIAVWALASSFAVWRFQAGVEAFPRELLGRYGTPYAAAEAEWRERLARGFDEILHGDERRSDTNERLRRAFDASTAVILRRPAFETRGTITVVETSDGLAMSGGGPKNFLWLPAFEVPSGTTLTMRLDVTLPDTSNLILCYGHAGDTTVAPRNVESLRLPEGRSTNFAAIRGPAAGQRMALRFEVFRATIHDLEIRAVPAPPETGASEGSTEGPR